MQECFACGGNLTDEPIVCPQCHVATYCSLECQTRALNVFEHGTYCPMFKKKAVVHEDIGVQKLDVLLQADDNLDPDDDTDAIDADGVVLIDESKVPAYQWFKTFLLSRLPELENREAISAPDDYTAGDSYWKEIYKAGGFLDLVYQAVSEFMKIEVRPLVDIAIYWPSPFERFYKTVYVFSKYQAWSSRCTLLLEQLWYSLNDAFAGKSGTNRTFYNAPGGLRELYKRKLARSNKRKAEDDYLDDVRKRRQFAEDAIHAWKKKRHNLPPPVRTPVDIPLPFDLYLHEIASRLPALAALRLVVDTHYDLQEQTIIRDARVGLGLVSKEEKRTKALLFVENLLLQRDFLQPLEVMLTTMTDAEKGTLDRIHEAINILVQDGSDNYFPRGSSSNDARKRLLGWAWCSLYDFDMFQQARGHPIPTPPMDIVGRFIFDCSPDLFNKPLIASYYESVVDVMLAPLKIRNKNVAIHWETDNGLQMRLKHDDTGYLQFSLDQPSTESSFPWMEKVIAVNQSLRPRLRDDAGTLRNIHAFILYVLEAVDTSLIAYYHLGELRLPIDAMRYRVVIPVEPEFHGLKHLPKRRYEETANLAASSLRYGLRYRLFYNPELPKMLTSPRQFVVNLTKKPYTIGRFFFG